jgi:hypothetical protein
VTTDAGDSGSMTDTGIPIDNTAINENPNNLAHLQNRHLSYTKHPETAPLAISLSVEGPNARHQRPAGSPSVKDKEKEHEDS